MHFLPAAVNRKQVGRGLVTAAEVGTDMTEAPLQRFRLFQGAELRHLEASATDWFTPCFVRPISRAPKTVSASVSATALGPVKLVYAQNSGPNVAVDFAQQESNYVAMFAFAGLNHISVNGAEAVCSAQKAAILSPQMMARMRLSGKYAQLHLRIDRFALERHLEQMLGRAVTKPIVFQVDMDLTRPASASWMRGIKALLDDLDDPLGLSGTATASHPWNDFLMTGLLLAQPHSYSEELGQAKTNTFRPQSLRRVIDLIEKDPASQLSLTTLSSVAGVGPRSLQREFKEYMGVTPLEYIQWMRLRGAHDDLVTGNGDTVSEIAFRWGFTHPSRFAKAYKQRYGTLPFEVLRKSR